MKIIYSQRVWVNESLQPASIKIERGEITSITIGTQLKNAQNFGSSVIIPGVIDAHVHINEPGRTEWEGFETATKAAARGGTTMLVDMPLNSTPVVTTVRAFEDKLAATKDKLAVDCGFWGGAINANVNDAIALLERGCLGIKVFLSHSGLDEFPNISMSDLEALMVGLKTLEAPILAHCELDTLPSETDIINQVDSYAEYLNSRPKSWENEAVKAFVELGYRHQCKIHIVHLSSQDLLPYLKKQKEKNKQLSIETCTHYLLFEAENIKDGDTLFKCAPPIRDRANNQQLKNALKDRILDFITTDHSPAPPAVKEIESGNLLKAWGGIAGLQFLLSGSWTSLKETLSLSNFIPLVTSQPAHFLGLGHEIGYIKEGYRANITIWNPEDSYTVTESIIEHKHKATPYKDCTLNGQVVATMVNGEWAFREDKIVGNFGCVVLKR